MRYLVKREGSYISAITLDKDGKKIFFPLRNVYGAMVWATRIAPIYFSIMGQRTDVNNEGKCPLILLYEHSGNSPAETFRHLAEVARKLSCQQFYADLRQENREMLSLFNEVCRYHGARHIRLTMAPFVKNFQWGLGLIEGWADSIEIPEGTRLRDELKQFSRTEQEAANSEQNFPAIKALTFLLGSLERGPWTGPNPFGRTQGSKGGWDAWT